ncbi:MAG: phosphoribosyl-AMP cyclohydrolase, partial [Pseudomonadota bacterium]|nr:phosphoribosyl-AMP cyclohydrolase [Pseudomonadota bacterium]
HVGYRSCFYRSISFESKNKVVLKFEEEEKLFDPEVVYEGQENPTKL